jgi:hypothetical protein
LETVALLRADVRQLLAAQAAHEIAIERATAILCAEIAAGHIVAYGRPGIWRKRRFTSGLPEAIPSVFFAEPENTIQADGWATCGWDMSGQNWADWNGPDWGNVRFKRDDAFELFGKPISGGEAMDADSDASRTITQALQDMRPTDGWPRANADVEDIQRAARREVEGIRARRIERFRQRQRKLSEWVCFADISDWCARTTGDIKPDEERRILTYQELRKSLTIGEFEQAGRSRVLFLSPATSIAKMTRERFDLIATVFDGETLNSEYLSCCWIPRDLCQQWFDSKRLPTPQWLARSQASPVPRTQSASEYSWTEAAGSNPPAVTYDPDDRLLEHKAALFDHLVGGWRDLFNASFDILLYDLTSTYPRVKPKGMLRGRAALSGRRQAPLRLFARSSGGLCSGCHRSGDDPRGSAACL